jgi:hypothetical protein
MSTEQMTFSTGAVGVGQLSEKLLKKNNIISEHFVRFFRLKLIKFCLFFQAKINCRTQTRSKWRFGFNCCTIQMSL